VGEVTLPPINPPAASLRVKVHRHGEPRKHVVELYRLYLEEGGKPAAVRPRPDLFDEVNKVASAMHRFGREMPVGNRNVRRRFLRFSKHFIRRHFTPIPGDVDATMDEWLRNSNYSQAEADELRRILKEFPMIRESDFVAESFIKDEAYPEYKYPRSINAYNALIKGYCGAIQHLLDKALFSCKWSVKFDDMKRRAERLRDLFSGKPVSVNDSSSFEAHHEREFAKLRIYWKAWIGQRLPGFMDFMTQAASKANDVNIASFKGVKVSIEERLFSGDMSTSSDNFVLNLCLTMFVLAESLYPDLGVAEQVTRVSEWPAVFEGDDGIFERFTVREGLLAELGVLWKKEDHERFEDAAFCQIRVDPETLTMVADPMKILADFGCLGRQYFNCRDQRKLELLRCKAMSFAVAYENCPVVHEFCHYVMRATRGMDVRWALDRSDRYRRSEFQRAVATKPWLRVPVVPDNARAMVAKHFGVSVETQLRYEQLFRSRDELGPYPLWSEVHPHWRDFAERYAVPEDALILRRRTVVDDFIDHARPLARKGAVYLKH